MLILKMTPRCGETHIFTHSYYDPFQNEERHVVVVDVMSPEIRANVPRQPRMFVGNITMVMDKLLGVSCWG